jgi:hypothetical protein
MNKILYSKALNAEQAGDWEQAHRIVQEIHTAEAAWIHAYLHRVEGDLGNAAYWYRQAGKPECRDSLAEEWQIIYETLSGV